MKSGMKYRLFLIEDNCVDAKVFEQMLGISGAAVDEFQIAENLSQGILKLKTFTPDIIFLDLALGDSNGIESYQKIRQQAAHIPIVILTGNEEEKMAIDALREGAQDYLIKSTLSPVLIARSIIYSIERKRIEQELLASRANNIALIENTKDGIWSVDKEFRFTTINSRFSENFQQFSGHLPVLGENMLQMVPEKYKEWFSEIFRNAINGEQFRVETKLHFNNEDFHIELSVNPINIDNEIAGVSFFAQNINQRKLTEERIRKSEHAYRLLLESINEGIVFIDNDNQVRFANSKFTAITGFTEQQLTGNSITSFFSPADPLYNCNLVSELLKDENPIEINFKSNDGHLIWFQVKGTPLMDEDGQVGGFLITHTEITAQKNAEEVIRKHEQDYRNLLETMNEGLVYLEKSGTVKFANQRFVQLSGYDLTAISNKRLPHQLLPETLLDLIIEENKGGTSSESHAYQYEIQVTTNANDRKWCMINCSVIRDEVKAFSGLLISYADITDRKSIEDKLQLAQRELNTFIYKSSHDLKGPLSSILGLINLLEKEENLTNSSPCVIMIRKSAEKLDTMLNELLNVVRIKREKIYPEQIDFRDEIRDVMRSLASSEGYYKVRKDITVENGKALRTDKRLLDSILQNLIDNAIRYRRPDVDSFVSVYVRDFMHGVKIEVEDNGKGFDEKTLGNIFTMFNRGNSTSPGNGMGLYIVKNSIDRLGGYIEASLTESNNTRFTIFLPDLFSKEQVLE
jgi:PAS domain S-box-containing protein